MWKLLLSRDASPGKVCPEPIGRSVNTDLSMFTREHPVQAATPDALRLMLDRPALAVEREKNLS